MSVTQVAEENFQSEVLGSETPVLVDFWAEWCGPCRMIAPVLEQVAEEYEGRLQVKKLNVDEAQQTAFRYNVRSIPTLILFKNGEVKASKVGATSKSQLEDWIRDNV